MVKLLKKKLFFSFNESFKRIEFCVIVESQVKSVKVSAKTIRDRKRLINKKKSQSQSVRSFYSCGIVTRVSPYGIIRPNHACMCRCDKRKTV